MKKSDLNKTYFVPIQRMRMIIDFLNSRKNEFCMKKRSCENNLYVLQRTRFNTFHYSQFGKQNWIRMFCLACRKALYSHDWDKLLYLLRKVPKWKFSVTEKKPAFDALYIRYLTLLLTYHPSSQAQGLLSEYLHMTLGCRSDQDKKAILKILLDLPKKLPQPSVVKKQEVPESD